MEETERGDPGGDVPALSALAELREPDQRSMMWIVGGAAAPEAAAENHKRVMTQLDVPDSVPDAVRKSFDRIRSIYRQGLFCYDLYTVTQSLGIKPDSLSSWRSRSGSSSSTVAQSCSLTGRATCRP